jgi:hypothetical protein
LLYSIIIRDNILHFLRCVYQCHLFLNSHIHNFTSKNHLCTRIQQFDGGGMSVCWLYWAEGVIRNTIQVVAKFPWISYSQAANHKPLMIQLIPFRALFLPFPAHFTQP